MKFLFVSSWVLIASPLLSFGLNCYYCKGTGKNMASWCAVGEEIVEQECVPGYPPDWWCRRVVSQDELQTYLGCEQRENSLVNHQCSSFIDNSVSPAIEFESCRCQTDLCNNPSKKFLKCWGCSGKDDKCEEGEAPIIKSCLLGSDMCYKRVTTILSSKKEGMLKIGCTKKYLPDVSDPNSYYNIKDASFSVICYRSKLDPHEVYIDACYCTSDLCNIYFNQTNLEVLQTTSKPEESNGTLKYPSLVNVSIVLIIYYIFFNVLFSLILK